MENDRRVPGSFRDPSGQVFVREGRIYRQVNVGYKDDYEVLTRSGLYERLVQAGLLISHEESQEPFFCPEGAYKLLRPAIVPFVSYPYEWCFSQLKDAALTTLRIQREALDFGMSLKDASAYNIQFVGAKPVLIDTLSFERYREGRPWIAYRQFCQHFLAPLSLASLVDIRLSGLQKTYLDGIPLDLTSALLPRRTHWRFSLAVHIHWHAKAERYFSDKTVDVNSGRMSQRALRALIDSLESLVRKLHWRPRETHWMGYYDSTAYSPEAFEQKKLLVASFLNEVKPGTVWDLGANTGLFSRIAAAHGAMTVAFDSDPGSVEKNYLDCVRDRQTGILPLWADVVNPSPGVGWENEERFSLEGRGPADAVMALALTHHLALTNHVAFGPMADFFSRIGRHLVIEFVPKNDPQAQRLLRHKGDLFPWYTRENFEMEFARLFTIRHSETIGDSGRRLYLMSVKR